MSHRAVGEAESSCLQGHGQRPLEPVRQGQRGPRAGTCQSSRGGLGSCRQPEQEAAVGSWEGVGAAVTSAAHVPEARGEDAAADCNRSCEATPGPRA